MIRRACLFALWLTLSACSPAPATVTTDANQPQPPLPTTQIQIAGHTLQVEVADTDAERRAGLSYRTELASNSGMLFVYREDTPLHFTMRETRIPLSIAFADADGLIYSILQMIPRSNQVYSAGRPGRYALEVTQGWFREHNVNIGDRITPLP